MILFDDVLGNACKWLIDNAGPAIRYRVLTEIKELDKESVEVKNAYSELLKTSRVNDIFSI